MKRRTWKSRRVQRIFNALVLPAGLIMVAVIALLESLPLGEDDEFHT